MKTIKIICLLSAMSFASFSCSKMEESKQPKDYDLVCDTFTIGAPETKTSLENDDKVSWNAGDIIVYYSNTGDAAAGYQKRNTVITAAGGTAQVTLHRNSDETFYVLCSAGIDNETMGLNDRNLTSFTANNVLLPEQTGEFSKANLCVGYVDLTEKPVATDLTLQNVTSLVEFSVKDARNITKVEFSGNKNEVVAGGTYGRATVDVTQSNFVAKPKNNISTNISTLITISKEAPMNGNYYFSVFPGIFTNGFKLKYYQKYTTFEVGTSANKTFSPGKIYALGDLFSVKRTGEFNMPIGDIMEANGVTTTETYIQKLNIDDVTVEAPTKDGSNPQGCYYSDTTPYRWHLYQARGENLEVSTSVGNIKSVTISYTTKNTGTLKDGDAVISSGTTVNVGAASKTFTIGNTGTATNGQVRITNIKVILEN